MTIRARADGISNCLTLGLVLIVVGAAQCQTLQVNFDASPKADKALGRAEPWVSRGVELVSGKFGKAARVGSGGQLIYAGEQNLQSGRGTLACWCRIPERPGPLDVQRLIFVQSKERGYWNYLATLEWQESVFRATVFDFYHGHGWHDPTGLPTLQAGTWHHVALVWDQAHGTKFFLDGQMIGSTWGKQAWWDRPTPHAIHLCYPGAEYDELCVWDRLLSEQELTDLVQTNKLPVGDAPATWDGAARERLARSLGALGLDNLPPVDAGTGRATVIRQARVRQALDDRIPSWKTLDGRMNLFWPEWRAPTLGDVDYSGSELSILFEPGQKLTHLTLRGLVGGCEVFGERDGYVSRQPIMTVQQGLHFLAAERLPANLTGLRIPRRDGMKLHEVGAFAVDDRPPAPPTQTVDTPLTGALALKELKDLADDIRTTKLREERVVLGKAAGAERKAYSIAPLARLHLITEPVAEVTPLDALEVRLNFIGGWKESVWWLRVQDPVNPRRDLMAVPVRVVNPTPSKEATIAIVLDFWDIMFEAGARLRVELLPMHEVQIVTGGQDTSRLSLWPGLRDKVLKEFTHTQSQLAYSYWQLGSEQSGTAGADPTTPGFALLGSITHNRELKLTLEWVRRHAPDHPLTTDLWKITFGKQASAPVKPRRQPEGAPEWAVWERELLERFRAMSHHWADRQGPDGQLGGGWNDDTDFPGVFLCLPLLGDRKTQTMFTRIFDGLERTGYLHHSVSRSPIDALHATDFLSWRAHLMLFDYGQPRHVERALDLSRELQRWTKVDDKGHRRFLTGFYSEDGPGRQPATRVGDSGLIEHTGGGQDGGANRNFLRDPLFAAWYSRNPTLMKFLREVAEGDHARVSDGAKLGVYESYPFFSYYALFGERKFLEEPVDRFLRDRWSLPIWRRYAERLPNGNRLDADLLKATTTKAPSEEQLTTGYLISKDKKLLVRALRDACERLEGGWQFRGGAAGGANDHFHVPGQAVLSQMYLGSALTWLRPASILPPIAVSWEGLDAEVAALVLEAGPRKLRVAAYNFDNRPRKVRMRVWELDPGVYDLRQGGSDGEDRIVDPTTKRMPLQRSSPLELELSSQKVVIIELEQRQSQPRPELLPDLAVGDGDIYYDKATDRLKVVIHNIGSAAAKDVVVRFEGPDGQLLGQRVLARLEAPLDLHPKTAVVWLSQPTLHPVSRIIVRIDPEGKVEEITRENNTVSWVR